jgi:hypothetical protein
LLTYVAAFRSVAARARPLHHAACISRRANTILIAQGAELLGRYDSDARTTGVVPLDNCQGHRPPSFGPKTELEIVPQRFFTHQQAKLGDRHVYASRSRFVPDTILGSFDTRNWREQTDSSAKVAGNADSLVVDVAASLMRMWQ